MYVVSCGVLYWFCGAPAAAAEVSHDDNNKSKTAVQRVVWDHLCTKYTPGAAGAADVVHTAHRNCDMITIGP